jgi:signal transduction histidine kinase/ligand-binding sensor domain-containing protein
MRFVPLPAALILVLVAVGDASAIHRVYRTLDDRNGIPHAPMFGLAQDPSGYLWLGTLSGVGRYDGIRFRSWSERASRDRPHRVLAGRDREVLVLDQNGVLMRVGEGALEPVAAPDGSALVDVDAAAFGPDGALWIARAGTLLVRRAGDWLETPAPPGTHFHEIAPLEGEGALIAADTGVHRLHGNGTTTLVDRAPLAVRLLQLGDERYLILSWEGTNARLAEVSGGERVEHGEIPGRPIDVARRGDTLWVASDRYLAAFRPGEPPAILGPEDGLPSGGPLLVDREGSLWVGSFAGLLQFPEPDTVLLNDEDGLPSSHSRHFNRTEEGIWVSTWQGAARISSGAPAKVIRSEPTRTMGPDCVDARGVLWSGRVDPKAMQFAVLERLADREIEHRMDGLRDIFGCAAAHDGGLWMAANLGILRTSPRGGRPVGIPEPPRSGRRESDSENRRVFEDSSGRLWLSRGRSVCRTSARSGVIDESSWTCEIIEAMRHATAFLEPSPGVLWMSTAGGGVLRRESGGWETIPASVRLATSDIVGLRPSPSGGTWVVGSDLTRRVDDRPDLAGGWEVLEEITGWHGVPEGGREDVLELEDGTLWITTGFGPARLPAAARQPPGVPPRVELAEMIVDGNQMAPQGRLELPYDRNRLELHFSALSYRDPGLLRYRIRTGRDERWSEPVQSPFIRFADLAPGPYRVEVAASLDSERWSPAPAVLDLEVGRPWYLQAWFLALSALLLAAGIYAVHRARVESLLRLERQRERIARDLHDEMGSALGSVGILAELASGDRLDESRRRAVFAQIAETVSELGSTLDDIVWSLAQGARKVDSLAAELASRGRRLFPDGTSAFRTEFPQTWPDVSLSPAVFRNVLRIAVEALHNAARHSGARSVNLALEPLGRRWRLRVEDDGNGLPADPAEAGTGLGLGGMRRRAEEIGAEITWESPPGGGTAVTLEFDPDAGRRRSHG